MADSKRHHKKRQALQALIGYVGQRIDQCDCFRYVGKGRQIVSGSTEAMCKVLTCRLTGSGMRWDRRDAKPSMALDPSNAWKSHWQTKKTACTSRPEYLDAPRQNALGFLLATGPGMV